jgi:hypothetical protein
MLVLLTRHQLGSRPTHRAQFVAQVVRVGEHPRDPLWRLGVVLSMGLAPR